MMSPSGGAREGGDGPLDLCIVAHLEWAQLDAERRRDGLHCAELAGTDGEGGIANDTHPLHAGRHLLEQLQPFSADPIFEINEASGIAAGTRQTVDETSGDRVRHQHEHDGNRAGHLQQRSHRHAAGGEDDIRCKRDQFSRVTACAIARGGTPADVDLNVAPDEPTPLLQALGERRVAGLAFRIVDGRSHEHADAPHPLAANTPGAAIPPHRRAM
jgi:hypothetical protein